MSFFDSLFNSDLSDRAQTKFDLALIYFEKRKYHKAYATILEAEKLEPNNSKIRDFKIQIECVLEDDKKKVVLQNNLQYSDPWVVFNSENIDEVEVKKYIEQGYFIENVAFGQNNWYILLRERTQSDPKQSYMILDSLNNETFNTYFEDRFVISTMSYNQNTWFFVLEHRPKANAQAWTNSPGEFPTAELKDWGSSNGKLEQLFDFSSTFFTSASFPNNLEEYRIEKHQEFPKERISELWNRYLYIDKLFFADDYFFLVICQHTDWEDQSYLIVENYPSSDLLKKMAEGFSVGNLFFQHYQWYLLLNKEKKNQVHIIGENKLESIASKPQIEDNQEAQLQNALDELNALVGMKGVKEEIKSLTDYLKIGKLKEASGFELKNLNLHMIFSGNPGTGKTTVARLLGRIFKSLGLLEKGHVVETDRAGLVGEYIGKTAIKTTKKIEESMGGILFVDEAYALYKDGNDFGNEALETILKQMEDKRDKFCVILAGYPLEMSSLLDSNSGLKSRFGTHLVFNNFSGNELTAILKKMLLQSKHQLTLDAEKGAHVYLKHLADTANRYFGNAREVRNLLEDLLKNQSYRLNNILAADKGSSLNTQQLQTITLADLQKSYAFGYKEKQRVNYQDIIQELNELIGLDNIKEDVTRLAHFLKLQTVRINKGIPSDPLSLHAVFMGPSGTGKTTVARLLTKIYKSLGLIKKDVLVEVSRADLVAGYVGQTAIKTNKIIDKALHGILFIDEAYALTDRGEEDFGHEALETILKRMEDDRHRLIVIVAGYEDEMKRFIESNPGLESRFTRKFHFQAFNVEELERIFYLMAKNAHYNLDSQAINTLADIIKDAIKSATKEFGNARWVRNFLEYCKLEQAQRLSHISAIKEEQLQTLTQIDLVKANARLKEENEYKTRSNKKIGY